MGNGNDGFNPFDVLEELKNTGFQQNQAESLAKIFSDVEFRNIATKQDIEEVKRDIKELETSLKRDIKELETSLKRDIKELDFKIENVKSELKKDIKELELKITKFQNGQTYKIIGAIAALMAVFRFLPEILK